MNILVCDDNPADAKIIKTLLDNSDFNVHSSIFHSSFEALRHYHSGVKVDVCFLDIFMPEMTGITLAEKLRSAGFPGEIVFLTTSNDFASESYKVKAFSYLLKPPMPEDLREVLNNLENKRKAEDTDGIMIKTKKTTRFIRFCDISYVEVINHHVYFRLRNGESEGMIVSLSEIAPQLLRDSRFVQCHQSFIVNMSNISCIRKEITMQNGTKLPLSKSYARAKNKYLQWGLQATKNE